MRKILLFALSLLLIAGCSKNDSNGDTPAKAEPLLPKDKHVVINYWAEWCKPCREEIPEFNKLANSSNKLVVYAVNFDGKTGAELDALATDFGIEYEHRDMGFTRKLGLPLPSVLPTTVIFNTEGELTATLVGPQTMESLTAQLGP